MGRLVLSAALAERLGLGEEFTLEALGEALRRHRVPPAFLALGEEGVLAWLALLEEGEAWVSREEAEGLLKALARERPEAREVLYALWAVASGAWPQEGVPVLKGLARQWAGG